MDGDAELYSAGSCRLPVQWIQRNAKPSEYRETADCGIEAESSNAESVLNRIENC